MGNSQTSKATDTRVLNSPNRGRGCIQTENSRSGNATSPIKPPRPFMTQDEFFQMWPSWKNDFQNFKKTVGGTDKNKWGNALLNYMGPVGQEIHRTFFFKLPSEKENVDNLFEKFDEYYIFSARRKKSQENFYEYIKALQIIVKEKNIKDGDKCIRKKVLNEINEPEFANAARSVLPKFEFSSDFDNLTLQEIAFIWNLYKGNSFTQSCRSCGNDHMPQNCPASNKQCAHCNEWNHFSKRCPTVFVYDCIYCGNMHVKKKCPAYSNTCTKCQMLHHFSWKCRKTQILRCNFCNLSHVASRSVCPALNTLCVFCGMTGHYSSTCRQRRRPTRIRY